MGKLHQVLAVESDAKNVMIKVLDEARKTFSQRSGHFNEERKSYLPLNEKDNDRPDEQYSPMVTTVSAKLDYIESPVEKAFDILLQKERANQIAKADIEVAKGDGTKITLIQAVPVTVLVQMEKWLTELRNTYETIPTLDPAKKWIKSDTDENVWCAEPVMTQRTRKEHEVITLHPGNDKHPPQTQLVQIDKVVGRWKTEVKSGALSPRQKSRVLAKIDAIITGVKIARAKANDIEVEDAHMGDAIFQFINNGLAE
jgi:hypothetical protein